MIENTLIGRQPILNAGMECYAYELLFRGDLCNEARVSDDRYATSKVLSDALNNFGLDHLVDNATAFVNVDYAFLMDPVVETIPPARFVLEILEDVVVDEVLIERVKELHAMGFVFAIDDLDFSDSMMGNFAPLLEYVSILKIDIRQLDSLQDVQQKMRHLKPYGLMFLAEKVETMEEFEACQAIGFSLFQGYFFAKPTILEGKKLNPDKMTVLRLITLLQGESEMVKIEQEFSNNPALSINLLRYLNSAAFGFRANISSMRQAISMLGRNPLAQWLTLFVYVDRQEQLKHANLLLDTALIRAETMMRIAGLCNLNKTMIDKAYLVGLLSFMESILQAPFAEIFKQIDFETEIVEALVAHSGVLGQFLDLSIALESGELQKTEEMLQRSQVSPEMLSKILYHSIQNVAERCAEAA